MNYPTTKVNKPFPVITTDVVGYIIAERCFVCEDSDLRANDIQSCWNSKTGEINPPKRYRILNPKSGVAYTFTYRNTEKSNGEIASWEYDSIHENGAPMYLTIFND